MQRDEGGRLIGLLAEPERLQVVAAVVLGAVTQEQVAEATGLSRRTVATSLSRLIDGGLVLHGPDGYSFDMEELRQAARAAGRIRTERERDGSPADSVLSRFLKHGRLVSMPATRSKRMAVLDHLAQDFEPGRYYEEREVNRLLKRYHDDYATLRRYLVDEGFLSREGGKYWRTGGTVTS
jgi:biotin operon repressor